MGIRAVDIGKDQIECVPSVVRGNVRGGCEDQVIVVNPVGEVLYTRGLLHVEVPELAVKVEVMAAAAAAFCLSLSNFL